MKMKIRKTPTELYKLYDTTTAFDIDQEPVTPFSDVVHLLRTESRRSLHAVCQRPVRSRLPSLVTTSQTNGHSINDDRNGHATLPPTRTQPDYSGVFHSNKDGALYALDMLDWE